MPDPVGAGPDERRYKLWLCDECGDHCEVEPGMTCEACDSGTCRIVEVVPAHSRPALDREAFTREELNEILRCLSFGIQGGEDHDAPEAMQSAYDKAVDALEGTDREHKER